MIKFSLLSNALPSFTRETPLEKRVDDLQDYQVQLLDFLRYALQNLEADNFNETGLEEILEPILVEVKGVDGRVSSLKITADGISSTVEALGDDLGAFESWAEGEISSVKSSVTQTAQQIELRVQGVETDLGELESTVTQTANSISAIVSNVGSGGNVTAASIVAAINRAGSSVQISADHVDISGFVTFTDLEREGWTTINGSNITTGEIRAINFYASGSMDGAVSNSFNVISEEALIGRIGYQYVAEDGEHADKMWLLTEAYPGYGGWMFPSIKIQAAGGVSIQSVDGHGVFIYDGWGENSVEWMFKGGYLYRDGVKVL